MTASRAADPLPEGARLPARCVYALLSALPPAVRDLPPNSRALRAAMGAYVAATPGTVMPSRSELRDGWHWLKQRGVI